MTVRTIEFSGRTLAGLDKAGLINCLDANPSLVASYKVFPKAVRFDALDLPALIVETADLTGEQHRMLASVMGLSTGLLVFNESPS